jgi:hypothetical protein
LQQVLQGRFFHKTGQAPGRFQDPDTGSGVMGKPTGSAAKAIKRFQAGKFPVDASGLHRLFGHIGHPAADVDGSQRKYYPGVKTRIREIEELGQVVCVSLDCMGRKPLFVTQVIQESLYGLISGYGHKKSSHKVKEPYDYFCICL